MNNQTIPNALIDPYASLADAIAERVGCYDIYSWLIKLEQYWRLPPFTFCPINTQPENVIILNKIGFKMVLRHPHGAVTKHGTFARWRLNDALFYFSDVEMGNWAWNPPFGISQHDETPETLRKKLGHDTSDILSDFRQSYFLDDNRVVEVTWLPNLQGISRIWLSRLGDEIDFNLLGDNK